MMDMIDFPDVTSISPKANIIFYTGIPWDDQYEHVRMFDSRTELDRFLTPKAVYQMTQAAPIKIGNLDVDVPFTEMQSYHMEYCRFLNAPYDNTPHYAFVTNVEWLSVNSTRITLELDIWNECQFDMDTNVKCWVERTHVSVKDDIIGKYTFPENLETGDLISVGSYHHAPTTTEMSSKALVFATTFDLSLSVSPVGIYQGTYGGLSYIVLPIDQPDDIETVNNWLESIFEKNLADGIVNAYIVPAAFAVPNLVKHSITITKPYTKFGTYTPKCKKCFTYPYKKLLITDNNGTTAEYKYEDFYESSNTGALISSTVQFDYYINTVAEPTMFIWPRYYRSINNAYYAGLTYSNFSKIAIATDTYKMWLAQNSALLNVQKAEIAMDTGTGILSAMSSSIKKDGLIEGLVSFGIDVLGTATGTGTRVAEFLAQQEIHRIVPAGVNGVQSNGLITAMNLDGFRFYTMECKEEFIGKIDSFFWTYGYAIGDLMGMDIIKSRKYWNYIKTIGCTISGNLPLDMTKKLRAIFDKGVTIWHTNEIGNYDLNNNSEV